MTITTLPAAPSRSDTPANFISKADAFLAALALFVTEVNAAAAAFGVTKWVSGTTYAAGDLVWSPTDYLTYRRKSAGGGTTDPTSDGTNWALAHPVVDPMTCDFRLTLTAGTPVTTADVTGAATIYASPYRGNQIALYDGARWNLRTSAEFSLALGTLSSGKPYDVFCYDNNGVPTLEFLAWTNDTTRATALTKQDGVYVKTGALTRRYLGTFYTTSTTTTEDSLAKRYLWNYHHRVARLLKVVESTDTWTYTTAAWRQANDAAGNQLEMVIGVSEDLVDAQVYTAGANDTAANVDILGGIGVDSTTVNSAIVHPQQQATVIGRPQHNTAIWSGYPGVGRHYLAWLEYSDATGTTTWRGDSGNSSISQCGIIGKVSA